MTEFTALEMSRAAEVALYAKTRLQLSDNLLPVQKASRNLEPEASEWCQALALTGSYSEANQKAKRNVEWMVRNGNIPTWALDSSTLEPGKFATPRQWAMEEAVSGALKHFDEILSNWRTLTENVLQEQNDTVSIMRVTVGPLRPEWGLREDETVRFIEEFGCSAGHKTADKWHYLALNGIEAAWLTERCRNARGITLEAIIKQWWAEEITPEVLETAVVLFQESGESNFNERTFGRSIATAKALNRE